MDDLFIVKWDDGKPIDDLLEFVIVTRTWSLTVNGNGRMRAYAVDKLEIERVRRNAQLPSAYWKPIG